MSEEKESTAIAKTEESQNWLVPSSWGIGPNIGVFKTSMDRSKKADKLALLSILNTEGEKPDKFINTTFEVVHLTILPITFESKQNPGEEVNTTRVCLSLKDNRFIDFRSSGVLKSLLPIISIERPPPWIPALKLRLERRQLSGTNSMYVVNLA